ncbi:RNA-binding KH domain-containing protein [Striga asiatica]|uniref:RNA-binding KH domain-containing protein n=1 Tax=Striga asiatica TaxID=4170 RepID=A0A5A7PF60_STRAF|nr:RNA-binding KH domain-containing protein [Striga asiatica]
MSQTQTPADANPNPNPNPTHQPSKPAPEVHPNHTSAAPSDKTAVAADDPCPSDPAVASTATTAPKRPREEGVTEGEAEGTSTDDAPAAKRRVRDAGDLIYRIVVPSRQIGKVIGRSGHRIQKIREDSKAAIKIADAISRNEERVIIISSEDSGHVFSDAENALHQIVNLILKLIVIWDLIFNLEKDDEGDTEASKVGAGHVAANTVRLLIAGSQAGGLIGVSGQNIVNLRNTSGAAITIMSPNQLPPCASAHESDRVVQISGELPAVLRAVVEIGCQLRDNPPKQVISVNPTNNTGFRRQSQQHVDPNSGSYVTLDVMVPENLVGGLIGRFGANISRIRNESGANIKVYGGRGEQKQRQIHLGGNAQQVALAKQRVDEYVYAELMRQAGGQLPLSAVTAAQFQQFPSQQPVPDSSNALYQGYAHPHALYATSNQESGLMTAISPIYGTRAMNQVPPYYDPKSYPAPQF